MYARMFDIWIERETDVRGVPLRRYTVWVQSRRVQENNFPGRLMGVAVRPLVSGLRLREDSLSIWIGYAIRTAIAWNAIQLACELFSLRWDTPPWALADLADEGGYPRLAQLLKDAFGFGPVSRDDGQSGPVDYPRPAPCQTGELGYIVI